MKTLINYISPEKDTIKKNKVHYRLEENICRTYILKRKLLIYRWYGTSNAKWYNYFGR